MEACSLYGPKKGSLSKGAEDALIGWLNKPRSEREAKAKGREEGEWVVGREGRVVVLQEIIR